MPFWYTRVVSLCFVFCLHPSLPYLTKTQFLREQRASVCSKKKLSHRLQYLTRHTDKQKEMNIHTQGICRLAGNVSAELTAISPHLLPPTLHFSPLCSRTRSVRGVKELS